MSTTAQIFLCPKSVLTVFGTLHSLFPCPFCFIAGNESKTILNMNIFPHLLLRSKNRLRVNDLQQNFSLEVIFKGTIILMAEEEK